MADYDLMPSVLHEYDRGDADVLDRSPVSFPHLLRV